MEALEEVFPQGLKRLGNTLYIVSWRKGYYCYIFMESSAPSFVVTLKVENVLNKLDDLAKDISRQSVEIATSSFLLFRIKCKRSKISSKKFH